MSDKSFGDHTNRNIVKNPLLSSAVTGLSLEDLTHKAVLLPVSPSQGQITRPDQQQGSQARTLAYADHETPTFPSGDAFPNVTQSNITKLNAQNILDSQNNLKNEKNRDMTNVTQSKASVKSDDDFDVNEYIARLQGSRYVSAPLHSHLKEDQNANLEATDENLEEINLNESQSPVEVQQSLTADIAQNFSQLPAVLPHVASAVFSSFSNMLSYKSREQTPDRANVAESVQGGSKSGYDEVQFQRFDVGVPLMGMEDSGVQKEVAPPPKEPPVGGLTNFRITSRKKYAQIPGLSSGEAAQTMTYNAPSQVPFGQNMPPFSQNVPPIGQNMPPFSQNVPPIGQNMPPFSQNVPPIGQNMPHSTQNIPPIGQHVPAGGPNMPPIIPPIGQSIPPIGQSIPPIGQSIPPIGQKISTIGQSVLDDSQLISPIGQSMPPNQTIPPFAQTMPPVGQNVASFFNTPLPHEAKTSDILQPFDIADTTAPQYNIFNPVADKSQNVNPEVASRGTQINLFAANKDSQNCFTPIQYQEQAVPQNIPPNPNAPGSASIIPPPPMFSNLPRRDNQAAVGMSILPPSVARRISANQPIIKPTVSTPSFSENIFVPSIVSETPSFSQTDSFMPTGLLPSAFVPAYTTSFKSDPGPPSSIPPQSHMMMPSSIPPPTMSQTAPATHFIPSNEEKSQSSTEVPIFFTSIETDLPVTSISKNVTSSANSIASTIPPAISTLGYPPALANVSAFISAVSNDPVANVLPASSIFTPGNIDVNTQSQPLPPSIFQPSPQNLPPQPTFFNPLQQVESLHKDAPHPITQMPPMATLEPKPVVEPPKATGNVNFRMIKKRPQYYAGPIEGVGAISNNVKPMIAPVMPSATPAETSNFQGALFTPEQSIQQPVEQYALPNIEQASVPFDISRPMDNVSSHTPFIASKPQEQAHGSSFNISQPESQSYEQEYNTAFDMSRATNDLYDPPKQESKGFGIIGSLKSKLSSIDINKIQSTVTTFFDPAYNEAKAPEPPAQDNTPYEHQQLYGQQLGQTAQEQNSFDIFVPKVEQYQYNQFKHVGYDYKPNNQNLETEDPYAQKLGHNEYSTSSYFADSQYSTEQIHTGNPLYDNTQTNLPDDTSYTQKNIPEKVEIVSADNSKSVNNAGFYNPNAFTQESVTKATAGQHQTAFDITSQHKELPKSDVATAITKEKSQQNVTYFNPNFTNQNVEEENKTMTSVVAPENITYYNPNAFMQENRQLPIQPQQSYDVSSSLSQTTANQYKNNVTTVSSSRKSQEPVFYYPNKLSKDSQMSKAGLVNIFGNDIQQKTYQTNADNTSDIEIDPQSTYDSALNTSKYKMASMQTPTVLQNAPSRVPLLPAASFFDDPAKLSEFPNTDVKISAHALKKDDRVPEESQQEQFDSKHQEIDKILADTPIPQAGNKGEFTKTNDQDKSLSKDNIPMLGVSSVPLFGLSAMIADKSREITESENQLKNVSTIDGTQQPRNIFEGKTGISFFENKKTENKIINETQAKEIPQVIKELSITDLKNVLIIEPPRETIGAVLIRNASSHKLESVLKTEEELPQHFRQQNDNLPSSVFREKLKIKYDENISKIFFKHSSTADKEVEDNVFGNSVNIENKEELNICETCREVNTPDLSGQDAKLKETESLTMQMIENLTSPMQLSNPLTVPLTEDETPTDERPRVDDQQCEEITHIAEDTIENLHMQSATELLDDVITTSEVKNYGWSEDGSYSAAAQVDLDYGLKVDSDSVPDRLDYGNETNANAAAPIPEQNYDIQLDPNAIGLFGNNSVFFESLPTNASDEIKAEIQHSHEDVSLPQQISIPSAPPAEVDTKSDETGVLDVHSIEQDAKNDFPIEEEFIIEPSETDDDKIEFRERKRSSEDSTVNDTFTNRIERFKKAADVPIEDSLEQKFPQMFVDSPTISMASYFDTGNYAVESHYRNSLSSPTSIKAFQFTGNVMRIPPGFEEEYARRLSGISLGSGENRPEPYIPDTSTQTRPTVTTSYSNSLDLKETGTGWEMGEINYFAPYSEMFSEENNSMILSGLMQIIDSPVVIADPGVVPTLADPTSAQPETIPQNVPTMLDPINFFSANVEETELATESAAPESFNRLASYFSMPPAQPERTKSFFELSQSQNHYRHVTETEKSNGTKVQKSFFDLSSQNRDMDDDAKKNLTDLMKDLTSPQNIQDEVVTTVNFFTVEYDNDINQQINAAPVNVKPLDTIYNDNVKTDVTKMVENDCKDSKAIINCKYCLNNVLGVTNDFNVKSAMNGTSDANTETEMTTASNNAGRAPTAVNFAVFDMEGQGQEDISVVNENRLASEYTTVKHHWFYRVDVEEKSVWRGFSLTDSRALEDAYLSPDLNEGTLVATDGGRYDVNVMGRLRIAVYWKEKPTNVRRCSWFYKGTTDARYVPYTEAVAEKLEDEYHHGVTTGEWHRKLSLPNSEMVIMHGPSVMVHFLHAGSSDAFSTPPQATSRPRVVRRGYEESEIEDSEPSGIDHLLLLCHGVGSACDMRFRSVEEVVEDFRATSLQLLESHYRNSFDNGIVSRVEVLPISWHAQLHSGEDGVDRRLSRITLDSIPRLRAFTNHTVLDVLFYTSPVFHQTIIDTVCSELNRIYDLFKQRNPNFKGNVSLGGHSLGSVILYDLLSHQLPEEAPPEKVYAPKPPEPAPVAETYPQLVFSPAALYALGSPIAIFECIRGVDSLGMDFALPTCKHFFNIFHPYDPIAYRIEPLINPQLQEVKPSQIPHHKGRKRMHLELKDTMVRVGADLKQKLIESLRTTWNKWKAVPPTDGQLEKVVEEEIEKEQLCDDGKEDQSEVQVTPEMLGHLNSGRRVDYVLQEAPLEMINEYLFAMSSHVGYWESEDTMLLMLREIYSSLGVQPDSTVPQQSMTVHRTRTLGDPDEATLLNDKDCPSTSRAGT